MSEVDDDDNATSFHNQSSCIEHYGPTDAMTATCDAIFCASVAVGIPGSILSATVWLRRRKTSSAVYLAALAIDDVVHLLADCIYDLIIFRHFDHVVCGDNRSWLCAGNVFLHTFLLAVTGALEPLLVLSFSVERLMAILRPFQVCR